MNVYKLKRLYQLLLMVFYIITIGALTILYGIYVSYTRAVIFALLCTILVLSFLFTCKVYIKSDEIFMKWMFNICKLSIKWKEITKVEYENRSVCIYNLQNQKMKLSSIIWGNYKQLWMQIYEEVNKNNNECIFDESFINLINCLKTEDKR